MAQKYGVNPTVLANLITTESNWQPGVVSEAGAIGIAQFMPATAREFGIDPYDPYASIEAAARYLKQALDKFGRYDMAVASYLMGMYYTQPGSGYVPDEARTYVSKVLGGVVPGAPRTGSQTMNQTGWTQQPWMTAANLQGGQGFGPTSESLDSGGWYNQNTGQISKNTNRPPGDGWVWAEHANVGQDFAVKQGTNVTSPVRGTVTEVNLNANHPWGIYVRVKDASGYIHNFGHLESANVRVGAQVNAGTSLGAAGSTGASTGPHVSYDITDTTGGHFIDPDRYLKAVGGTTTTTGGTSGNSIEGLMAGPGDWDNKLELADWVIESLRDSYPDQTDYDMSTPEGRSEYNAAISEWSVNLQGAIDTASALRAMAGGYFEGPDGIPIPWGDLPPAQRAALEQAAQMGFTKLMNDMKITTYGLAADRAQNEFQNKVSALSGKMQFDQLRLDQARDAINRALDTMAESRSRAQLITEQRRLAAPYATTAGKTSFTGRDLGGGIGSLAAMAGMSMDSPVIQYPTSITLDPAGLIKAYDEKYGVPSTIPGVPDLLTQPGDIDIGTANYPDLPVLDTYPGYTPGPPASGGGAAPGATASTGGGTYTPPPWPTPGSAPASPINPDWGNPGTFFGWRADDTYGS
jgi:murein DD-endopeptidase MepM/ murein hydrolase activator NlpD